MTHKKLPKFVAPMLARAAKIPFDSDDYLFEVKWDGMRCLAYIDASGYRLVSRHGNQITQKFPAFSFQSDLPSGTVLDGELVVLRGGKPDFTLLQSRTPLCCPHKIRTFARTTPATYVVFDQLFGGYRPLMDEPLTVRRNVMFETVGRADSPRLIASDGVVGAGI